MARLFALFIRRPFICLRTRKKSWRDTTAAFWRASGVLIVLDNAGSEAQLRPLLTVPPPVGFLITSRHVQAPRQSGESVPLDGLLPEEAFTLLRRIMGTRGTRDELLALVKLCCRLPSGAAGRR